MLYVVLHLGIPVLVLYLSQTSFSPQKQLATDNTQTWVDDKLKALHSLQSRTLLMSTPTQLKS